MTDDRSEPSSPDWYDVVYAAVRAIPSGKVATYGQIADTVSGLSLTARQVGTAMRFAPKDVPWQRVVGAGGRLPIARRSPELKLLQARLLLQEGVEFRPGDSNRIDMARSQFSADEYYK
jgi:methylated-DNA-protein-cysteine methyltransferase-like protein